MVEGEAIRGHLFSIKGTLEKIRGVLKREREVLLRAESLEAEWDLQKVVEEKQVLVRELELDIDRLRKELERVGKALGVEPKVVPIARALGDPYLEKIGEEVESLYRAVKEFSAVNNELLSQSISWVRMFVDILSRATESPIYSREGKKVGEGGTGFSREA